MNLVNRQKQHERFLLDCFLETLRMEIRILEEKRESPDFIVCLGGRKIGVELTELFIYNPTSEHLPQAQESMSDRIVSQAQRCYQKSSGTPAHVTISFYKHINFRTLDRNNLSQRLSSFVLGLELSIGQSFDFRHEWFEKSSLPEEIAFLRAERAPNHRKSHWKVARAGWARTLTTQKLQTRINEKSKKLKEYQKVVPENWLIITSHKTKPSQLFDVPDKFDASGVISPFTRTFYFTYPDKELIELAT